MLCNSKKYLIRRLNIQFIINKLPVISQGTKIPNVNNIIAIASGKGGVGKSTLAANIAVILARMGFSIGLLDADIYGPSIPILFGVENAIPRSIKVNGEEKMKPIIINGIKVLSIGFFTCSNHAVVWRGPLASKALRELIRNAHWSHLDFLIVDLPPGTGDIHISLVQEIPLTAAVIVSTPQKIALAALRKTAAMFRLESINVPILGIIENMAYFSPSVEYGGNGRKFSNELQIPFLGQIPLIKKICEYSDIGKPVTVQTNKFIIEVFEKITKKLIQEIIFRNKNMPTTEAIRITTMAGCSSKK